MAMFTLYCDDSGTHAQSDIAVAACYVSTVEQWERFKRSWDEADEKERFGVFHMADFVARKEPFDSPEWAEQAKRDRTMNRLINIIRTRVRIGFAVAVVKSAYDEIILGSEFKDKFSPNHYAFAFRVCTALVDRWRSKYDHHEPVEYVFDRLTKGKGEINSLFERLLRGKEDASRRYGVYADCWSFQDKARIVQLQAADIWAWENYRYVKDCFLPKHYERISKTPRLSYLELRRSPVEVRYHLRETLQALVEKVKRSMPIELDSAQ